MTKKPELERVIIPMSVDLLGRIEDFRFAHRAPSRAEAMRALLEAGLAEQAKADAMREREARERSANIDRR